MARFLQRGLEATMGNGSAAGQENTIQSFNITDERLTGEWIIDIVLDETDLPTDITGFFLVGQTEQIQTNSFPNFKYEVGDDVVLHESDGTGYRAQIDSVGASHIVVEFLDAVGSPPTSSLFGTFEQHSTVSGVVTVEVQGDDLFTEDLPDAETGELIIGSVSTASFQGISTIVYDQSENDIIITFADAPDGSTTAAEYATAYGTAIDPLDDEPLELQTTRTFRDDVTLVSISAAKDIVVGFGGSQSSLVFTPITLPQGLTIRAGRGVEDIFLTYHQQ